MAVDKLVDSGQLDNDLTSVANAIRTKGGTSTSLDFPSGFVTAIGNISGGGGLLSEVTITTAQNSIKDSYDALQSAIGSDNGRWIAFVDDSQYFFSGNDNVNICVGCVSSAQRSIYTSVSDYGYCRRFGYTSTGNANIPANTKFKVVIFTET